MYINSIRKSITLYDVFLSILIFTLPFSTALPNIILSILTGLYIYEVFFLKKESKYSEIRNSHLILVLLFGFLFIDISINGEIKDYRILLRFLIFLILPVLVQKSQIKSLLKLSFVLGVNIGLIFSSFLITKFYIVNGFFPFSNTTFVNQILLIERPYLGFMCLLNIVLSFTLIKNGLIGKKYLYFSILFSVAFIVLISARMSIISLILVTFFSLCLNRRFISIKKILLTLFTVTLLIMLFGGNILERFYVDSSLDSSIKKAMIYEPRFTIWECAIDIINFNEFNILVGSGSYIKVQESLLDCYNTKIVNKSKREYYLDEKFNFHNQFIDFFIVGGIIAFSVFLLFWLSLFYNKRFKVNVFLICVLIIYILFFSVENVLHRQLGCYLFGCIFMFISKNDKIFLKDN